MSITDGVYDILSEVDTRNEVTALGRKTEPVGSIKDLTSSTKKLLKLLEENYQGNITD